MEIGVPVALLEFADSKNASDDHYNALYAKNTVESLPVTRPGVALVPDLRVPRPASRGKEGQPNRPLHYQSISY